MSNRFASLRRTVGCLLRRYPLGMAALIVLVTMSMVSNGWWEGVTNLIPEAIGIVATVTLVDYFIEERERRRRAGVRHLVVWRLNRFGCDLLIAFYNLFCPHEWVQAALDNIRQSGGVDRMAEGLEKRFLEEVALPRFRVAYWAMSSDTRRRYIEFLRTAASEAERLLAICHTDCEAAENAYLHDIAQKATDDIRWQEAIFSVFSSEIDAVWQDEASSQALEDASRWGPPHEQEYVPAYALEIPRLLLMLIHIPDQPDTQQAGPQDPPVPGQDPGAPAH